MANAPMYHDGMRQLQDARETRRLADRLESVTVRTAFTDDDRAFIQRVTAERIFPNCPRYLHKMQLSDHSAYAPRSDYTPPVPAWKTFTEFRDALPARDRGEDS